MVVYYFAPFDDAETDFDVIDAQFGIGFFRDSVGWTAALAGLGANDALAIQAHGNSSLLLCSSRDGTHPNRAWVGPHQLWAMIRTAACPNIIIQACDSIAFGRFFKTYMPGKTMWAYAGTLGNARWGGAGNGGFQQV